MSLVVSIVLSFSLQHNFESKSSPREPPNYQALDISTWSSQVQILEDLRFTLGDLGSNLGRGSKNGKSYFLSQPKKRCRKLRRYLRANQMMLNIQANLQYWFCSYVDVGHIKARFSAGSQQGEKTRLIPAADWIVNLINLVRFFLFKRSQLRVYQNFAGLICQEALHQQGEGII